MKYYDLKKLGSIGNIFRYCLMVGGLSLATTLYAVDYSSETYSLEEYTRQIDQQIAIVNQTKLILDDPDAKSSALDQKNALCERIRAYRNIQTLSENHLHHENAFAMKMVSDLFLEKQQKSFAQAGMNESAFCGQPKP